MLEKEASLFHERILEVLEYNQETGAFTWKVSPMGRIKIGQQAGSINTNGHRQIRIDGMYFLAHRLVWFYVKKVWPSEEIDHIDLDKDNNSFRNLREANRSENCRNRSPNTNTSGYKGVIWHRGQWQAQIKHQGKCLHLGGFDDPATAHEAYKAASKELHGAFGRTI
jgi:hypothetical protein